MKKLLLVICAMLSLNVAMAQKNVLIEEATGTWCVNCPSGIYYIDSLQNAYDNVIAIAIHANWPAQKDPMSCQEYFEKSKLSEAPAANINRSFNDKGVDQWFDAVNEEMNKPAKASVAVATEFNEETRVLTATLTITALDNMEGSYTVSGVVVEDAVTVPSPQNDQANLYATIWMQMGGFENMPNPIPSYMIAYDHVARHMLGGYEGEAGFPATLAKGETYTQTFTYTIPEGYDHNYIKVVGILLNGNGTVDNAGISSYVNGKDNAAPKFTSSPVVKVPAGVEYIYNVYAHDTDGKNIVITAEEKPEWLSLEQKGKSAVVKGTPTEPGEYTVVLNVTDGEDETLQEYTISVSESLNASWETLGERGFNAVGFGDIFGACSYNGDIYTFIRESSCPTIYKYSSKDKRWIKLQTIMEIMGYDGSIAAGNDGVYIAYTLLDNELLKVKKYANEEWSDVGEIGKLGSTPKIAVDAQNNVYVSFDDKDDAYRHYLHRYKNGNWEVMGETYINNSGKWERLVLDSKGTPYASWIDTYSNTVVVAKLIGDAWLHIGNEPVSDSILVITGDHHDMAVADNGYVYAAYCTREDNQLVVYRHNGAEWELLGNNLADGTVRSINMEIDNEQNIYVAYADGNVADKVSVLKYDGTEWSYVGQRGFTEGGTDIYVPVAMTLHKNSPCIVYKDIAMGSKASAKYYKLSDYLYPVSDLEAGAMNENDILLTWVAPFEAEPTKYNIYRNDALIGNTAETSYIDEGLETGTYNYAVAAVYEDGESEKVSTTVTFTVSITENNEVAFMMYPNPAKDYLTIESANAAVVKIYSVSGQMLSEQNINEGTTTIDLSNLNAGIYFISVNETVVRLIRQ